MNRKERLYNFYKKINDAERRIEEIEKMVTEKEINNFGFAVKLYNEAVAYFNGLRDALETLGFDENYYEWQRTREDLPF